MKGFSGLNGRAVAALVTGFFLSMAGSSQPVAGNGNPWSTLVRRDLQAVHDLLKENHPGPVDPLNSHYRKWLEQGLAEANHRAEGVTSLGQYERALRFYTNGFRDGHLGASLIVHSDEIVWPGLLLGDVGGKGIEVVYSEKDSGVSTGDLLRSCDSQSLDELMTERIDPYYWNRDIPHQRYSHAYHLLFQDAPDAVPRLQTCTFSTGEVRLKWRRDSREKLQQILDGVRNRTGREPALRKVAGVWMLAIPTFAYSRPDAVRRIRTVIAEISSRADELRRSTVVFDVRGNHGGDSFWGEELASALWGKAWVERIARGFDNTVDWRASASNLAFLELMRAREQAAGLQGGVEEVTRARDAIKAALESGQPLARVNEPARPPEGPAPANPVSGRVYLLTDGECASACLDFADLIRRLPGVRHAGLPTSADAIYIDNTYKDLPSGLAGFGYSMKVFRNRVRKNNEWYEPEIRWPGGPMTDEAVAKWIGSLERSR